MSINFDTALGPHPDALAFRAARTGVIASNIANADTPGYQARDLDFAALMRAAESGEPPLSMSATRQGHLADRSLTGPDLADYTLWHTPNNPSVDGNTVETHVEQARFAENALQMQAALTFLSGRFSGLISAFRGE